MKKTILTFGLISGVLSSLMMVATVPLLDKIGFDRGEFFGYTAIVLSFLLVFFGIRSYRDNVGHGRIRFTEGFVVGISITVLHDFMDKYGAYMIEKLKASGASAAAAQAQLQRLKKFKELYEDPLF